MSAEGKIVIVGAGVAGLTLAYSLCRVGREVIVVEKDSAVGGLARSFEYDGFKFDIGPHRFHTDNPRVLDFIHEVLEEDFMTIERKSGVWMFGRYFDWPLELSSVFRMPFPVLLSVGLDMLRAAPPGGESFDDYIIGRYGKTLYRIFFEPYTVKFLKLPCKAISKDWAVTGIDRAVIDKKIRAGSLGELLISLFSPAPPLKFLYPLSGGIGVFSQRLDEKIKGCGGRILLNARVSEVLHKNGEITELVIDGKSHKCGLLAWSAPVSEILRLLGYERDGLEYLSLLLFNYKSRRPPAVAYQWCYFGSRDIRFNRVSFPSLFNPRLAPEGKSGICVEVTCMAGSSEWKNPEALEPEIRHSLVRAGLIGSVNEVEGLHIERIPNAYPIYTIDYSERLRHAENRLRPFSNLRMLGRTGTFWYNNMDHSIEAALRLYEEVK